MRTLTSLIVLLVALTAGPVAAQPLVHQATADLDQAQTLALPSTAVVLVPAQADRVYIPVTASFFYHWTADVTNISSSAAISVNNDGYSFVDALFEQPSSQVSGMLANGEDTLSVTGPLSNHNASPLYPYGLQYWPPGVVGKALVVRAYNAGLGDWTGGAIASRLTVSVAYLVLNTTTGLFE